MSSRNFSTATEARRPAFIRRRQEESVVWKIVHILGSLRLAMFLLLTIAAAIGTATFMESKFTTEIARYYIYRAPWFTAWLILLCFNLLCAALTRWPWERKHLGFVITHAGIITLLIGAMTGRFAGYEAFITLHKNQPPQSRLISQETILTVQSARDGGIDRLPFEVDVRPPTPQRPRLISLPDSQVRLKVDDYTSHLADSGRLIVADADAPQGVALHFFSAMMKQAIDVQLLMSPQDARQFDFFGLARVELAETLRESRTADQPFHEAQVALASHPQEPVIDSDLGRASGYQITLAQTEKGKEPILTVRSPAGVEQSWPLSEVLHKTVSLPGNPVKITASEYWPDFDIHDGKPSTLSAQPRNPAILVRLTGPRSATANNPSRPVLRLAPGASGQIDYQLSRNNAVYAKGGLQPGRTIALGWADWQARLDQVLPHARIVREWRPQNGLAPGVPGIRARLIAPDGAEGEPRWIVSGTAQMLPLRDQTIRVGFGLKPIPLPFSIALENFAVPRDEGSDTPSDFIASLRFADATGKTMRRDEAHMNYPAMYPGGFWRSVIGWNYKFSQSGWDPDDLGETTLQVLYDPGWPLKWSGSLMICIGIAVMFYFKPAKNQPIAMDDRPALPDVSASLNAYELATNRK